MENLKKNFEKIFNCSPEHVFTCGGRFEILGNHTDHNHGLCLAATCSLSISACVSKNGSSIVRVYSKGFKQSVVDLKNLNTVQEEKFNSASLVRGIANYLVERGYKIGGFDLYSESTIFPGAGVSSSAAFELLIAEIFNQLFNEDNIEKMILCKAGQYAENIYFGKKSGLLDQIGVGFGNIVAIDFKNENPTVENVEFPFKDLHFVIVNTGGSHAKLSDLYSKIPQDMYNAAEKMGCKYLRESSLEKLEKIKGELNESEYLRSLHFYNENKRVSKALSALKNKDEQQFLNMINESRISSTKYLKNMMVGDEYEGSPLQATDLAMKIMDGKGATKINGGGFAGSIICVVPSIYLKSFIQNMKERYGRDNIKEVFVRNNGPIKID